MDGIQGLFHRFVFYITIYSYLHHFQISSIHNYIHTNNIHMVYTFARNLEIMQIRIFDNRYTKIYNILIRYTYHFRARWAWKRTKGTHCMFSQFPKFSNVLQYILYIPPLPSLIHVSSIPPPLLPKINSVMLFLTLKLYMYTVYSHFLVQRSIYLGETKLYFVVLKLK